MTSTVLNIVIFMSLVHIALSMSVHFPGQGHHDSGCSNKDRQCYAWAAKGDCIKNKFFMEEACARACGKCLHASDHSVPHINPKIAKSFWNKGFIGSNVLQGLH